MRAWQVVRSGEPREALELGEVEAPEPGPGLIRVRVAAAGVGLPDLFMCRGSYPLTPGLPFTPGQELVGTVTAVGEGAQAAVGRRVMAVSAFFVKRGGFAEEALALDNFAFEAPDEMPDAEAAGFLIPWHTAFVGLVRRASLRKGETLLVLGGAGGTGSAAVQLGRALGARVLATAGGPAKAAFCARLGAEVVIDHHETDIAEAVREATGGHGADVVYDPVGGAAFSAATHCIAHEGRLCLVGFASGEWGRPSAAHMATHNYSVVGVIPSAYDRSFRQSAQDTLMDLHGRGEIRVPIHAEYPFESLPEALEALERGRVCGKAVLRGPNPR
jgi:NADPH2:quinone reductase